jgi:hypothetical protein
MQERLVRLDRAMLHWVRIEDRDILWVMVGEGKSRDVTLTGDAI